MFKTAGTSAIAAAHREPAHVPVLRAATNTRLARLHAGVSA